MNHFPHDYELGRTATDLVRIRSRWGAGGGGEQVMTLTAIALVLQIWVFTPCLWMTQMHNEELREERGTASP